MRIALNCGKLILFKVESIDNFLELFKSLHGILVTITIAITIIHRK